MVPQTPYTATTNTSSAGQQQQPRGHQPNTAASASQPLRKKLLLKSNVGPARPTYSQPLPSPVRQQLPKFSGNVPGANSSGINSGHQHHHGISGNLGNLGRSRGDVKLQPVVIDMTHLALDDEEEEKEKRYQRNNLNVSEEKMEVEEIPPSPSPPKRGVKRLFDEFSPRDVGDVPAPSSSPPAPTSSSSPSSPASSPTSPMLTNSTSTSTTSTSTSTTSSDFTSSTSPTSSTSSTSTSTSSTSNSQSEGTITLLNRLSGWASQLDNLSSSEKDEVWTVINLLPSFDHQLFKESFEKTVNSWKSDVVANTTNITVLYSALGFLSLHGKLHIDPPFPVSQPQNNKQHEANPQQADKELASEPSPSKKRKLDVAEEEVLRVTD
eukprot:TRINITY_DN996_c0_g1_i4.p1 TRINITY_DN996_c0_g1~~TRINITY_DN996_c0_g1_i4.p1  ORF type:complete len:380 (-),score=120.74 TRINITY_DN996_c0_g1_i4:36-1175(-)